VQCGEVVPGRLSSLSRILASKPGVHGPESSGSAFFSTALEPILGAATFCMTALKPNLQGGGFCMTALSLILGAEGLAQPASRRILAEQHFSRLLWH
jgi:hypothetical protein